jgi:hypothetical protein
MSKHQAGSPQRRGWFKSSYSYNPNGTCVEVNLDAAGRVLVRDSKDLDGAVLSYPAAEWSAFVRNVRLMANSSG